MAGVPPSEVVPEMCSTGPVLVLFQGQPVGGWEGGQLKGRVEDLWTFLSAVMPF